MKGGKHLFESCGQSVFSAALREACGNDDPQAGPLLDEIAEQERIRAREMAAQFLLISEDRVPLAALNAEGVDAELARWFDPEAGPLRPITPPVSPEAWAVRRSVR